MLKLAHVHRRRVGRDQEIERPDLLITRWQHDVLLRQSARDVLRRQAVRQQLLLVEIDLDVGGRPAIGAGTATPGTETSAGRIRLEAMSYNLGGGELSDEICKVQHRHRGCVEARTPGVA